MRKLVELFKEETMLCVLATIGILAAITIIVVIIIACTNGVEIDTNTTTLSTITTVTNLSTINTIIH